MIVNASAYPVRLMPLPEDEGGGFVAWVPDLPGCMSDGETEVEAVQNVQQAITEWIEEARREGTPIPAPSRQAVSA
ncbi:MAG: type II toxin-antitoxin system HicB family antitoxin [Hyphomicrobiales bacterium]|nr:type II toxin-antitoxin system HicB family antitoxin [Hyphomicrobiales bacterium]MBV8824744.1 type II toxin-antitoxin system HicB family antitoxin [Hyphomicrobiales bacterium]MBV9428994.1 type II toxin-antitoxin system HicB family antitoxin [Bradyrhizobiaceae bacterium]